MDEAARRREARRARILQNSQNRLQKITGIEQKTCTLPEVPTFDNDFGDYSAPEIVPNGTSTSTEPIPKVEEIKTLEKSLPIPTRTFVVIGLALFVNLQLVVLAKFIETSNLNKIFLPFLIYEVVELLSSQKTETRPTTTNPIFQLLLLQSAKNPHIVTVLRCLQFLGIILQDLMIYFFVFVCSEASKTIIFTYF